MILIIFCVLYFGVVAFVLGYCFDEVDINALERISNTKVPTVLDAQLTNDYDLQKYIDKVIIPAHEFRNLKHEINNLQSRDDNLLAGWFSLDGFGVLLMSFQIHSVFSIHWTLCCLISIGICIPISLIVSMLYKKSKLAIKEFGYKPEEFKDQYETYYKRSYIDNYREYKINDKQLWNIYVIDFQSSYLSSLRETVVFRHSCRKIIGVIAFLIYILFFLQIPE